MHNSAKQTHLFYVDTGFSTSLHEFYPIFCRQLKEWQDVQRKAKYFNSEYLFIFLYMWFKEIFLKTLKQGNNQSQLSFQPPTHPT